MEEFKKILIICLCILCIGCTDKKEKTSKFQKEFEKYNESNIEVTLENIEIVKYSTKEKINKIIAEGTGVIFIGKADDDLSRKAISVLLESSANTDLKTIYYLNTLDSIEGLDSIENLSIPITLFVLDGKIEDYHIGTLDNKIELNEDETIELYNIYTDGIHKVLQDACDEEC